jgi:hypothetical protein
LSLLAIKGYRPISKLEILNLAPRARARCCMLHAAMRCVHAAQ